MRNRTEEESESESLEKMLNPWQKLWHWPGHYRSLGEIGAWSLGILVFASGFVLLLSAATPRLLARLRFADELLTSPLMQLSHVLSVVVGLLLIVLSWGISHRVKRAYWWTLFLLIAGALFTFTKAFDFEEAIFLLIVCILLWISRYEFYRMAAPFSRNNAAIWGLVTLVIAFLYYYVGTGTHPELLEVDVPWLMNPGGQTATAVIALSVVWLVILLILLFRPARRLGHGPSVFPAVNGRVRIAYIRRRNRLIVQGEPAGDPVLVRAALKEFRRFADQYSLMVVQEQDEGMESAALQHASREGHGRPAESGQDPAADPGDRP
jgi:phosphatidylglycerol lysyltransferase